MPLQPQTIIPYLIYSGIAFTLFYVMERYVHFYQTLINSYFQIPVKERNITKIELTKILFYLRIMAESFVKTNRQGIKKFIIHLH